MDDFHGSGSGKTFFNAPLLNQDISFTVQKVVKGPGVMRKTKDGKEFMIGLKTKDGKGMKIDFTTDLGEYTIQHWEIYFKLFGRYDVKTKTKEKGLIDIYNEKHNRKSSEPIEGTQFRIKRLIDASHGKLKVSDLSKILGVTETEAKKYQEKVQKAVTDFNMFEVELLN